MGTFQPTFTRPDPANPGGKRITSLSPHWHWRFTIRGRRYAKGTDQDGLPFLTRADALVAGERRKAEVKAGVEDDPRRVTFETLATILTAENVTKAQATKVSVGSCLRHLREFFGRDLAADITRDRILGYVAFRQDQGAARNSIRLEVGKLRQAMRGAHDQRRLAWLPRFPALPRELREQRFSPHVFASVVAALPEHYRRFYLAAEEMGWRARSELRTRQWPHVDFDEGWVYLEASASKTRTPRVFPLTEHLRALLLEQQEYVREVERRTGRIIPWCFCTPAGQQLPYYIHGIWTRALRAAGVEKIPGRSRSWSNALTPHDIRRTTLHRWEQDGEPRNATMAAAGHREERTFSGYVTATPDDLRRLAERLDRARAERAARPTNVATLRRSK